MYLFNSPQPNACQVGVVEWMLPDTVQPSALPMNVDAAT